MGKNAFLFMTLLAGFLYAFDPDEYSGVVRSNQNLAADALLSRHTPESPYFREVTGDTLLSRHACFDSIGSRLGLTPAEKSALAKNRFMVSERLRYLSFGDAYYSVYLKDLPVMVTTDAVLQALHMSYDNLLKDLEVKLLRPRLKTVLTSLYESLPNLRTAYQADTVLAANLEDVDVYVTLALSLLLGEEQSGLIAPQAAVSELWQAVKDEKVKAMRLFTENRMRSLDFSQFTVRGHYTDSLYDPAENRTTSLGGYFQSMMWLGRMDFLLTPPPDVTPWTREEIRRMNIDALLMEELLDRAGARALLHEMDDLLTFLVNAPDNLTPAELSAITARLGMTGCRSLLNDSLYDRYLAALMDDSAAGQKILSDIFMTNPCSSTPDTLPVSFRLLGQRFILDSYIFSNVVYDRVIFNDAKVKRLMPDPLDAMFVLGNDDALPLLKKELDAYPYAGSLADLRFLTDAEPDAFWSQSLYNTWLNSLRTLNPAPSDSLLPLFARTSAWHQEKLNTQLASWSQLRHDNLLYTKQSYTGGIGCSYPHGYVEPYPAFYREIGRFASAARTRLASDTALRGVSAYFLRLEGIMDTLALLSEKELARTAFSDADTAFLKRMLYQVPAPCGAPPFTGWYSGLFYGSDSRDVDMITADVHTQPTDEYGNMVGRVLHVGTGPVNLAVFLADGPSNGYAPTAYVGPVMSYYEKITENFTRLTDETWHDSVLTGRFAVRPDWVNGYLCDSSGNARPAGRRLDGIAYEIRVERTGDPETDIISFDRIQPNPFNPATLLSFGVPQKGPVSLEVFDVRGRKVKNLLDAVLPSGRYEIAWKAENLPSGNYLIKLKAGKRELIRKAALIK